MTAFTFWLDADRREDLGHRRVVGAVGVDVAVAHLVTGADDERRAELRDTLAGLVDSGAALPCFDRRPPGRRVQQAIPRSDVHRSGACRLCVVVDKYQERDVLVADERSRIPRVAGSDRDEPDALRLELVVAVAQLHGMVATVVATEVAQE